MSEATVKNVSFLNVWDLADPRFRSYSERGSKVTGMPPTGLSSELTVRLDLTGGLEPSARYKAAEKAILDRLAAARQRFLDENDYRAAIQEARYKLAQILSQRQQAEREAERCRSLARQALCQGENEEAARCERAALECAERVRNLAEIEADLKDAPSGIKSGTLFAMQCAVKAEAEAIRVEVQARLEAARAALPPELGELLIELWLAQQLAEWARPSRSPAEKTLRPAACLEGKVGQLAAALPCGYDGRGPRQIADWNRQQPDGLPPGACMGGPAVSPEVAGQALGSRATQPPSPSRY